VPEDAPAVPGEQDVAAQDLSVAGESCLAVSASAAVLGAIEVPQEASIPVMSSAQPAHALVQLAALEKSGLDWSRISVPREAPIPVMKPAPTEPVIQAEHWLSSERTEEECDPVLAARVAALEAQAREPSPERHRVAGQELDPVQEALAAAWHGAQGLVDALPVKLPELLLLSDLRAKLGFLPEPSLDALVMEEVLIQSPPSCRTAQRSRSQSQSPTRSPSRYTGSPTRARCARGSACTPERKCAAADSMRRKPGSPVRKPGSPVRKADSPVRKPDSPVRKPDMAVRKQDSGVRLAAVTDFSAARLQHLLPAPSKATSTSELKPDKASGAAPDAGAQNKASGAAPDARAQHILDTKRRVQEELQNIARSAEPAGADTAASADNERMPEPAEVSLLNLTPPHRWNIPLRHRD
jgi:hypothetical protein